MRGGVADRERRQAHVKRARPLLADAIDFHLRPHIGHSQQSPAVQLHVRVVQNFKIVTLLLLSSRHYFKEFVWIERIHAEDKAIVEALNTACCIHATVLDVHVLAGARAEAMCRLH